MCAEIKPKDMEAMLKQYCDILIPNLHSRAMK